MDTGCLRQRFSVIESRHRSSSPWQRCHTALMWPFLASRINFFRRGENYSSCKKEKSRTYRERSLFPRAKIFIRYTILSSRFKLTNARSIIRPIACCFKEISFRRRMIDIFRLSYFNQTADGPWKAVGIKASCVPAARVNEALSSTLVHRREFILRP